jgi:hypothetical protein
VGLDLGIEDTNMASWLRPFLLCALAAALGPSCTGIPIDNGPYRDEGYGVYGDRDEDYRDRAIWESEHRRYSCSELEQRIRYDRDKIDEIPPGRHKKARQWYVEDIQNAERALAECRGDRREDWRDRRYDRDRDRELERQREIDRQRERERARLEARAECDKMRERIRYDQAQIAKIKPGEHHKARQWFIDDIHNAERALANCRR